MSIVQVSYTLFFPFSFTSHSMEQMREEVARDDADIKRKLSEAGPKASHGYGGKFGVEADRMDKSAVGHEYMEKLQKHASQTDYATGFGGKFGVQKDRQDKVSFIHVDNVFLFVST